MLIPIVGITPISELLNLLSYQYSDSFSQLLFKEPRVKTYSREYVFDIIEHFHSLFKSTWFNVEILERWNKSLVAEPFALFYRPSEIELTIESTKQI